MAITRVGGTSATINATGLSLTWSTLVGGSPPAAGDLALLIWNGQSGLTWGGESAGFALLNATVADSGSHEGRVYYRVCTGSEFSTTLDLTHSAINKQTALLQIYRGVSTTAPISDWAVRDESSAGTSHANPQVTTVTANEGIVTAIQERVTDSSTNYTAPSPGYTKRNQPTPIGGGGSTSAAVADDGLAVSRAALTNVTPPNWTNGVSTANVLTWTFALASASLDDDLEAADDAALAEAATTAATTTGTDTAAVAESATLGTSNLRYNIAVDWAGDGDFTEDGDDVTGRTLERGSFTVEFGRDQTRALSPTASGRASLEIDNRSRDYSPDNVDSPLYGNILPARPLRIQAQQEGVTRVLFRGHTDDYEIKPARNERSVAVTGLDAVAMLKDAKVSTRLYQGVRTGDAIGHVLDAIGWPAELRDLDPGATLIRWWWEEDADAFEAVQRIVASEGPPALWHADEDGKIVFRDRHHRLMTATTPLATLTESTEPAFTEFTYDHGWRDVINAVSIKVEEYDPSPAPETVWEDESVRNIAEDETLELRVTLDNPVIFPGFTYSVHSGTTTPAVGQNSGQTVVIMITAGSGGATISNLVMLAQPVTSHRTIDVLATEPSSIDRYRRRDYSHDAPWTGVHDAAAIADLIIGARSERRPIVALTLTSQTKRTSLRLTQQLTRDLSDRVHIREPETGTDHDFHVEQIKHTAKQAGIQLDTEFGLERASTQADDVFRFDDEDHGFDDGRFGATGLDDPEFLFIFDDADRGFDEGVFAT